MNTVTDRISLTNDEIEQRFAESGVQLALDYGDDEAIVVTTDTLADFAAARQTWNEMGYLVRAGDGVFHVFQAQLAKGHVRKDLIVIDFGDVRLAYQN